MDLPLVLEISITKLDVTTGVSTITNPTLSFPGIVTVGNLVEYSDPMNLPTLNRVTQVNTNTVQVVGVEDVTAINGGTPTLQTPSLICLSLNQNQPRSRNSNLADNESLFSVFSQEKMSIMLT